jgi:protein-disulfide isomerase
MSGASRRERAAAARNEAQASEKRRERTARIVGAVAVVAVVVGIIGVAVIARNSSDAANQVTRVDPDPNAPLPEGVLGADSPYAFGVPYGSVQEGVPVLELWEDFQCPACGALEQVNGAGIAELAETGKIQLIWRPTHFLDANLGNDASNRAIAAWGCAIDAGKVREFHDLVYVNQPADEGLGYTQDQLIGFGEEAGIAGADLETFTQCVQDGTYRAWAANSNQEFQSAGIQGTPYGLLNGVVVENATLADRAALEAAVGQAGGQ